MGLVSLLLKRGANINARNFFGRTPLHDAVLDGDMVLSRALLDLGGYIITEKGHKMFLEKLEEIFPNDNCLRPVIRSG
ncbi:hypothetical protein DFP73DRAFT_560923 [Morchella snyderi]|nr:hypothetical protein DFP73DRAFT_560923 [Morchella snyderi]